MDRYMQLSANVAPQKDFKDDNKDVYKASWADV